MRTTNGLEIAYNAQAVADHAHQIIVASDVTTDANDFAQLTPMLDQAKENTGKHAAETLADSGYETFEQLHLAEVSGHQVLVNDRNAKQAREKPFHSSHFKYLPESDQVKCPESRLLNFEYLRLQNRKNRVREARIYRCSHTDCPFRNQCSKDKKGRVIEITPYHEAVDRQREKRKKEENGVLLAYRKAIIEPVFAHIKQAMGIPRFLFRTLEKVKTEWSMLCTAHNLRKIYPIWRAIGD